jgi:carbon-monoxide dehydrogenase small subunit
VDSSAVPASPPSDRGAEKFDPLAGHVAVAGGAEYSFSSRRVPIVRVQNPFPAPVSTVGGSPVSVSLSFSVNGKAVTADVDPRTLLVEFIRNNLALTGTHVGCDTGQCGACTVLIDGNAVKACTILAAQANGSKITTIEGLATDGAMHPMQAAFKECHGLQCGFCTPGMVLSAIDLVHRHPNADEAAIREGLEGNLCRCTGYQNIVKAVQQGAAAMRR